MLEYEFPQFRKAAGGRSYYKIVSLTEVLELQIIGSKFTWHHLKASIYPERLFIGDLLDCTNNSYVRIMEEEYLAFVEQCQETMEEWKS